LVDPDNWRKEELRGWKLADEDWQVFRKKWYGTREDLMLSTLLLAPLPKPIGGSSSSILIRESYKLTFDHIWARAMSAPWHGVVLTGQPGIGGHIVFPLSLFQH